MRKYFLFYIFLTSCSSNFDLQNGDFLFQDLDSSELCTAIEAVTDGYMQSDLSHIGLVVNKDEETYLSSLSKSMSRVLEEFYCNY